MQRAELGTGLACAGERKDICSGEVREETVAWSKDTYQLLKQAEQGKVKSYVQDIALAVLDCKETATSRETFIRLMNERGYGVDWQDSHKYITYTDLAREQERQQLRRLSQKNRTWINLCICTQTTFSII
ncbi:relaxase/mobilization nuclease domain-containing protein [Campylobacter coli]|uniref:relaxase/mobilization nuclease domain-containing protein n=1 Tax=Campylobacter coli TaxID=195 RepID=UPI00211C3DED|nr:relaxase/mobilization nuclease domain-containing protein [Campylobacter coli]